MQDTQVKVQSEIQSKQISAPASQSNSGFDNVEYERWSQNLRNRNGSKNK